MTDDILDGPPSGQIIIRKKGHFAEGTYLAHDRAVELARIRWDKVRAAKEAALLPPPVVEAAPPSSAAARRNSPADAYLVGPDGRIRLTRWVGDVRMGRRG